MADGPAVVGRPVRASGGGVYVIELPAPLATAPVDINRVGKWIERVPMLKLDGETPTSKALAARLAGFWLPRQTVLFVGSTAGSIVGRVAAFERHVLGDPRPHAGAQWLKVLRLEGLRVWWANTDAPEEYEDAVVEAFAAGVSDAERAALYDSQVILPFANLRTVTGDRKRHGMTGAVLPIEAPPPIPESHVVDLPPGDADGARVAPRGSGTTRRPAPASGAPARASTPRRTTARSIPASGAKGRPAEPIYLSPEGLARTQAELEALIGRRPEVVNRIQRARELGDLKENADYTAAREEQSFLEGRIQLLESQLRAAVVVETPLDVTRVRLGSQVTVELDGERATYMIVGSAESDPASGRISHASPIGKALVGRSPGEEAVIRTPGGEVHYRVVAIE
jgi:transcription elongation factor GreA